MYEDHIHKLEGHSKITDEFLVMMVRGGSTVAEPSTLNPKIEGLNPATELFPLQHKKAFDRKSLSVMRLSEKM